MKKLACILCVLLSLCASTAFAEDEVQQAIHEMFKDFSDSQLLDLRSMLNYEIEYRSKQTTGADDTAMRDRICSFFESKGYKIKRVMLRPLVEKDEGGLYGGKERWFVTFETGEQIAAWVADGMIDYCIGTDWFFDVPLL